MLKKSFFLFVSIFVLFCGGELLAQEVDFILDENQVSYRTGFVDEKARDYVRRYLDKYQQNMNRIAGLWVDSFAMTGVNSPVLGKPHEKSVAGIAGSLGYLIGSPNIPGSAKSGVGMKTVDKGGGPGGMKMLFFLTLSVDKLSSNLKKGLFENMDVTFKFSGISFAGYGMFVEHGGDVRTTFFDMGVLLRKQIMGEPFSKPQLFFPGASVSLGLLYSRFMGREDEVNTVVTQEENETVTVDNAAGKVTVSAPSSSDWAGVVHYPYFEHQTFSIDTEGKAYAHLFYVLDLFLGMGFSVLPYNRVYVDISSEVNIRATDRDDQELESHDGRLVLKGTAKGRWFIPRVMGGVQLNLGPIKIPIQGSWTLSKENKKVSALSSGITVSF